MEMKTVYCTIGERYKRIKFAKEKASDAECLRQALHKSCEKDVLLQQTMQGKFVLLQQNDPSRNRLCEIEDDDEIPDMGDVTVSLITLDDPVPSSSAETSATTGTSRGMSDIETPFDLPIVFPGDPINYEEDANETKNNMEVFPEFVEVNSMPVNVEKSKPRKTCIPYPASLPHLTVELSKYLRTIGIYEKQSAFITFWSTHLESFTDGRPTSTDYTNYARTIVDNYPELKGGKHDYGVVKDQLSAQIRNRRYYIKKRIQKLKSFKRSLTDEDTSTTIGKSMRMEQVQAPQIQMNTDETSNFSINVDPYRTLENFNVSNDSSFMKVLLQSTISVCEGWINKDARKIKEVISNCPQFHMFPLVMFEFCILKNIQENQLYESIEKLVLKLARYFAVTLNNEHAKAFIFERLYNQLIANRFKSSAEKLITIKEVGQPSLPLTPLGECWPRLVLHTLGGEIAFAFVVIGEIIVKIFDPSVKKAIACLLASYYIWDMNYPPAYSSTLAYIDQEIFGTTFHNRKSVDKFTRDVEYKLNIAVKQEDIEQ